MLLLWDLAYFAGLAGGLWEFLGAFFVGGTHSASIPGLSPPSPPRFAVPPLPGVLISLRFRLWSSPAAEA